MIQGSNEWLEWRREGIGSSDAPVIMGVSPWTSPYQLWREKLQIDPPKSENSAMARGKELEPRIRREFTRMTHWQVEPDTAIHADYPWMRASFDGINWETKELIEIKTVNQKDHDIARDGIVNGTVPDKYYPQLQHLLAVAGVRFKRICYVSYCESDPNTQLLIISVARDDAYIAKLIEAECKFMERIKNFDAPDLTDMDYVHREDKSWLEKAVRWKQILDNETQLLVEKENLKQAMIEDANGSNVKGFGVALKQVTRKGNVDYSAIPELAGKNLEQYRKQGSIHWTIRCN